MGSGVAPCALVLGGADCLWDDVEAVEQLIGKPWPGPVVACNEAGAHWPRRLHHWATFHPENFAQWETLRRQLGHPPGYVRWSNRNVPEQADRLVQDWGGGSSGLIAVNVAMDMGWRSVLCGVPLEERPHFHDRDDGRPWKYANVHIKRWERNQQKLQGKVKSMSGATRQLLGAPTAQWLLAC